MHTSSYVHYSSNLPFDETFIRFFLSLYPWAVIHNAAADQQQSDADQEKDGRWYDYDQQLKWGALTQVWLSKCDSRSNDVLWGQCVTHYGWGSSKLLVQTLYLTDQTTLKSYLHYIQFNLHLNNNANVQIYLGGKYIVMLTIKLKWFRI